MSSDNRCWCGGKVGSPEAFPTESRTEVCLASKFHVWDADGRPDKVQKIYLSGPMSGRPDCNYPQFNWAAGRLRDLGFEVVNPAEQGPSGHYTDILRQDLRDMLECDAVATLDAWWESNGARTEVQVAGLLMMPVYSVMEWEAFATLRDESNPWKLALRA